MVVYPIKGARGQLADQFLFLLRTITSIFSSFFFALFATSMRVTQKCSGAFNGTFNGSKRIIQVKIDLNPHNEAGGFPEDSCVSSHFGAKNLRRKLIRLIEMLDLLNNVNVLVDRK